MAGKNRKHDKDYYAWVVYQWITTTYSEWGCDITSVWEHIEKNFPNATKAFKHMHEKVVKRAFDEAVPKQFDKPNSVCEAVASLIPIPKKDFLYFDVCTKEMKEGYEELNIYPWNRLVEIRRVDLILAIMLFAEDFATQPLSCKNVKFDAAKRLVVENKYLIFEVEKVAQHTFARIYIKGVGILEYKIATKKPQKAVQ